MNIRGPAEGISSFRPVSNTTTDRSAHANELDDVDANPSLIMPDSKLSVGTKVAVGFALVLSAPLLLAKAIGKGAQKGFNAIKKATSETLASRAENRKPADLAGKSEDDIKSVLKEKAGEGKKRYYLNDAGVGRHPDTGQVISAFYAYVPGNNSNEVTIRGYEVVHNEDGSYTATVPGTPTPPTTFSGNPKSFVENDLKERFKEASPLRQGDLPSTQSDNKYVIDA